ncbi:hypothetical protein BDP55DRAFT_371717 [Colletotrichum godetiae]|uniref:Uncharacterized protein n=1 Tax=Colletotrichum godetiae TaxID=1209918 RepID=A0AAJ0ERX9_9PEZI|nr:uncharacterized protein BDP55DRAFT_371717 [Colletotrichum godetiae]KAK1658923.1 hypothetical protein BDP55DRAFT_371717 [Colletotrichum godetiae]
MTDVEIREAALNLTERDDPKQMSDGLANCVSCVWVCKTAATNILLPEAKLFHICFWTKCFAGGSCEKQLLSWAEWFGQQKFPSEAQFAQAWSQMWRPMYDKIELKGTEEE